MDYFCYSAFDFQVKATETLKYILTFSDEKHKSHSFRKILDLKIALPYGLEKKFMEYMQYMGHVSEKPE